MKCSRCNVEINNREPFTTGYGIDKDNNKFCYSCCAEFDKEQMEKHDKIILYLAGAPYGSEVTNWPGSLRFKVDGSSHGKHNLAETQTHVWFKDHLDRTWWGRQYGDFSDLCYCKLLKQREVK